LCGCRGSGFQCHGLRYHSSPQIKRPQGEQFHENTLVEIIWTIIPALILVVMAVPATQILIDMHDTSKSDMTIQITGYQWKWRYHYLDQDLDFFSNTAISEDEREGRVPKSPLYMHSVDNELVIPVHKKIRFLMTANDVIHSWWVPALGVKQDALPGFVNEKWAQVNRPGVYYGQCTELCGVNHGFMPIVVRAVSEQEFKDWVDEKKGKKVDAAAAAAKEWTLAELMDRGRSIFNTTCAACHKPNGEGAPPVFPALKGAKITTVASEREHNIKTILYGRQGTAMQAFGQQFDATDLASVITYIRNAWGNNTGDVIQPAEIQKYLDETKKQ
jgi:cytochrome c oxidase subunit II